ncbi:MAG: hypothetical protein SGARI_007265, partial [Bacillariaceae sp.]
MNFVEYSRSLLTVPGGYNEVRPHHLVLAAGIFQLATSSTIYRKVSEKILSVMSGLTESFIPLVQLGLVPDFIIRFGIRLQLRDHLNILRGETVESEMQDKMRIVEKLKTMPIAIKTDEANDQHYEVPAKFYDLCLGPRKKYSSGLWPTPKTTFEESEVAMLNKYCELAGVKDGM